MNIIPGIRKFSCMGELTCYVPKKLRVENNGFEPWCLDSFLERTQTEVDPTSDFVLAICKSDRLEKETYQLYVKRHEITIYASTERGVIWALTSLYQLSDGERTVPICKIADKPKFAHRGLMLDCLKESLKSKSKVQAPDRRCWRCFSWLLKISSVPRTYRI